MLACRKELTIPLHIQRGKVGEAGSRIGEQQQFVVVGIYKDTSAWLVFLIRVSFKDGRGQLTVLPHVHLSEQSQVPSSFVGMTGEVNHRIQTLHVANVTSGKEEEGGGAWPLAFLHTANVTSRKGQEEERGVASGAVGFTMNGWIQ